VFIVGVGANQYNHYFMMILIVQMILNEGVRDAIYLYRRLNHDDPYRAMDHYEDVGDAMSFSSRSGR